ncbi:hypothetical protein [Cytobacillus massiliigabonensis]|uniref:hypothetical protein n=1 Tax=Cytobacillus massiliigabonensis TaxID=1871011 RepID=UPI000C8445C2
MVKGYYYEVDGSYVRIVVLVVDSYYCKKGIGITLIEEAVCWAEQLEQLELWTYKKRDLKKIDIFPLEN